MYVLTCIRHIDEHSHSILLSVPNDPTSVVISSITGTTATVTWTAAQGNVDSYEVSHAGLANPISVTSGVTTGLTGLSAGNAYTVTVKAKVGSTLSAGAAGAQATFNARK